MRSILENDGLVGLENNGLVGLENDGSLYRDGLQIMSKPGEVGPPVSSPIPACLLQGQPSRRRGPPLAQGG